MDTIVKEKKILVFCPGGNKSRRGQEFETYLSEQGAEVQMVPERPAASTLSKIAIRLFKKRLPFLFNSYIRKVLRNFRKDWDYILVIRGEAFTPSTIKLIRRTYPKVQLILYLWDILKTNDLRDVIPFFDKVYSFDPEDCRRNPGLIFRPLYSMDIYKNEIDENFKKDFDISFIGTIHSSRARILQDIEAYCNQNGINTFFYKYIPTRIIWIRDKVMKYPFTKYKETHFKPASLNDIIHISKSSKAILDINYDGQYSLSMRAFEAMMMKRKFITTNSEIKKYDFYNPNNILVIDINNINIPKEFLEKPFEPIQEEILEKYTVKCLLNSLLGMNQNMKYLR